MFAGQDGTNVRSWFAGIKGAKENGTSGNYAGYLAYFTRPSGSTPLERMRITSAGNVGIGSASPEYKFVMVDSDTGWIGKFSNTTSGGHGILIDAGDGTSNTFQCIMRKQNLSDVFRFRTDGDAQKNSGAGDWSNYSDERLKEEITSLNTSDCLDIVSAMKPKKFKWRNVDLHDAVPTDDDGFCYGFIAQDFMEHDILKMWSSTQVRYEGEPDNDDFTLVETASRAGNDGDKIHSTSIGMDKAFYVGAIQELLKKNNTLETRIATLENA